MLAPIGILQHMQIWYLVWGTADMVHDSSRQVAYPLSERAVLRCTVLEGGVCVVRQYIYIQIITAYQQECDGSTVVR
jgi:hypothetical protein